MMRFESGRPIGLALLVALAVLILVSPALAQQFGSTYDWRSGNSYQWNHNGDGSTNVRGFNMNTGSQWNTTIQPNGNMRGSDSGGNFWNYNSTTGTYWNSNGTMCTGKGALRTCF